MLETQVNCGNTEHCGWVEAATRAARFTARRRRLSPAEAEDLRSEMWLKLLRRDGAVLKQFRGRGSLHSYLVSVGDRCVLDQRVRDLGKWRPSRRARGSGQTAVLIERLTRRDGMSLHEALEAVRLRGTVAEETLEEAESVVAPARPRRRPLPLEAALSLPCTTQNPEALLESARASQRGEVMRAALLRSLNRLTADDLRLLTRRFVTSDSVAEISRDERRDQKSLYRRMERLCQTLRTDLATLGITAADARAILGSSASPLDAVIAEAANRRAIAVPTR